MAEQMPRERDEESGKYTDAYTDDAFVDALRALDGLAGTADVAGEVGCSKRHALNRLRELEEAGRVRSTNVGRALAWELIDPS